MPDRLSKSKAVSLQDELIRVESESRMYALAFADGVRAAVESISMSSGEKLNVAGRTREFVEAGNTVQALEEIKYLFLGGEDTRG